MEAAQLADPEAPVAQPGHHQPVPCRHDGLIEQVLTSWIFADEAVSGHEFERAKAMIVETICEGLEP